MENPTTLVNLCFAEVEQAILDGLNRLGQTFEDRMGFLSDVRVLVQDFIDELYHERGVSPEDGDEV